MNQVSIKVKNYKCFGKETQGFEKTCPINIIIGKNNSGKSSLIDLVSYVVDPKQVFIDIGREKTKAEVIISHVITQNEIESVFPKNLSGGGIPGPSHYEYGMTLIGSKVSYILPVKGPKQIEHWEKKPLTDDYTKQLTVKINSPFTGKVFKRINAERDITPEGINGSNLSVESNGSGATNLVHQIINQSKHDYKLIKKTLLQELNKIINPDIEFSDILPRDNGNGSIEIYFENKEGHLVGLSKMGSGIKTILLVLLKLIVIPEIEQIDKRKLIFGFEELENNLHPSLQRRLLKYITEYANKYQAYFFITTHSNIVIDLFSSDDNAQIIHVENNGNHSIAKTISTFSDSKNILKDLDYRASDILLSNGVIWVEGPSDTIYLEMLINLYTKKIKLNPALNYCIQALSTAIWKHAGFVDFIWDDINKDLENKIISLARINHNHIIIIDKDNNYENLKPSEHNIFKNGIGKNKARLISESMKFSNQKEEILENNFGDTKDDKLSFWINDGTFETYLEYFILNKGAIFNKYFEKNVAIGFFEKKRNGENSSKSKMELAAEIARFTFDNNLTIDDFAPKGSSLLNKIKRLIKTIESWN